MLEDKKKKNFLKEARIALFAIRIAFCPGIFICLLVNSIAASIDPSSFSGIEFGFLKRLIFILFIISIIQLIIVNDLNKQFYDGKTIIIKEILFSLISIVIDGIFLFLFTYNLSDEYLMFNSIFIVQILINILNLFQLKNIK